MRPQSTWQKLISHTPFVIFFQSISAIFFVFAFLRPHRSDWTKAVIFCLFYGVFSTIAIKAYAEKYIKSLGLSTKEQSLTLAQAFKRGELPEDKKLRDAMPSFLENRLKYVARHKKLLPFTYISLGFFFLMSAITKYWPGALLFGCMAGLSVYSYFSLNKAENKIVKLQSELDRRGPREK